MSASSPVRLMFLVISSVVVWSALWGDISVANTLWGAVIGLLLAVIVPLARPRHPIRIRPLGVLRFAGYFAWALVRASAVVAWEVITPGSRVNEGIVAAPLRTRSPGLITLIASSISLTPGTLTLEIREDPPILYVHILHLRTIDETRAEIRHLEDLVLAAFAVQIDEETP